MGFDQYKETSRRDECCRDENVERENIATRKDKIRNEYISGTVKVERLVMKMTEGRLRWYGHVMRRDQEYQYWYLLFQLRHKKHSEIGNL